MRAKIGKHTCEYGNKFATVNFTQVLGHCMSESTGPPEPVVSVGSWPDQNFSQTYFCGYFAVLVYTRLDWGVLQLDRAFGMFDALHLLASSIIIARKSAQCACVNSNTTLRTLVRYLGHPSFAQYDKWRSLRCPQLGVFLTCQRRHFILLPRSAFRIKRSGKPIQRGEPVKRSNSKLGLVSGPLVPREVLNVKWCQ